ncbi:hypothetical protein CJF31_00002608 [Rutstroemia sp. NJR-2017a BVV2]|nr:hypothetical protein CJF31_00002608 [Rutstroemia sp. NJR-2017a BVV2]
MTQDSPTTSNESHSQSHDEDHATTSPSQPPSQPHPGASPSPSPHAKLCSLCHTPRDVLIRCQIDESQKWHFVCTGKCWTRVSGGKVDGDATHPWYRYGGMWKNKHEAVSAKIKGKAKVRNRRGVGKGDEGGTVREEGGGDD